MNPETTEFHSFVHQARAKLVEVGAAFLGLGSLVSAMAIYFASMSSPRNQGHAIIMVVASVVAFGLLWAVRHDSKVRSRSFRNLLIVAVTTYLPNQIAAALYLSWDHDRTLIILGIMFGAASMCRLRFLIVYGVMLAGWHLVSSFTDRQLSLDDFFYLWFFVPAMGVICGNSLRSHLAAVFELRQDVQKREHELVRARRSLAAERKRRELEEEKRRESEQIINRQNEQLWHVNRTNTMGEMVASIAHEINQPLNAIGVYVGVLMHRDAPKAEQRRAASQIGKLVDRCGKIIGRLRGFIRRDSGEDRVICMRDVIQDSIAMMANPAHRENVEVSFECDLGPPDTHVIANSIQLQQVVVNLLQNAIDATAENEDAKLVSVGLKTNAATMDVWVSDNGCGLNQVDQQRVFEAFYTSKTSGMGMGLAICRSILERYRGEISFDPNVSSGTTFRFCLPRAMGERPTESDFVEHVSKETAV